MKPIGLHDLSKVSQLVIKEIGVRTQVSHFQIRSLTRELYFNGKK